jgi:predicted transcriptional regulator
MQDYNNLFLNEFKKLEEILRSSTNMGERAKFHELLNKASKSNSLFEEKRNLIETMYALRNVIAHGQKDKYIAQINNQAFDEIKNIVLLLETPPLVGLVANTPVYIADVESSLSELIKSMNENIYSHVPIYDNEKYIGTFSENSGLLVLNEILINSLSLNNSKISDLDFNLIFKTNDEVMFIGKEENVFNVQNYFKNAIKKGERLGAIYITSTGSRYERPIGIITPNDIPKIKDIY